MADRHDEKKARDVIEKACPDEEIRKAALSILAEGIREANVYGRDKWTVRVEKTARLLVGNYYVCTIHESGVWIALDDRFTKSGDHCPRMGELNSWGWIPDNEDDPDPYRHYKDRSTRTEFSINGLYSIGTNHKDVWPRIRILFLDFIYKANYYGQRMKRNSPRLHSQGMLKYMRHFLKTDLPDPLYQPGVR